MGQHHTSVSNCSMSQICFTLYHVIAQFYIWSCTVSIYIRALLRSISIRSLFSLYLHQIIVQSLSPSDYCSVSIYIRSLVTYISIRSLFSLYLHQIITQYLSTSNHCSVFISIRPLLTLMFSLCTHQIIAHSNCSVSVPIRPLISLCLH